MTRQQAREDGRSLGLQLGEILAEATTTVRGEASAALVAARSNITIETIIGAAGRLSTPRKQEAFRLAAVQAVVDALDAAQVTIAASGSPN